MIRFESAGIERKVILDECPALNGEKKAPDEWVWHWNSIKDERHFASMKDMYDAFKQIRQDPDSHKVLLDGLRDSFKLGSRIVTSTRIFYNPNDLDARIVHNYGSSEDSLKQEFILKAVPVCFGAVGAALGNQPGRDYLQALLGTEDDPKDIIETVEYVSGKDKGDIVLSTLDLAGRLYAPETAAWLVRLIDVADLDTWLMYKKGEAADPPKNRFYIDGNCGRISAGYDHCDLEGRSFGARYISGR